MEFVFEHLVGRSIGNKNFSIGSEVKSSDCHLRSESTKPSESKAVFTLHYTCAPPYIVTFLSYLEKEIYLLVFPSHVLSKVQINH